MLKGLVHWFKPCTLLLILLPVPLVLPCPQGDLQVCPFAGGGYCERHSQNSGSDRTDRSCFLFWLHDISWVIDSQMIIDHGTQWFWCCRATGSSGSNTQSKDPETLSCKMLQVVTDSHFSCSAMIYAQLSFASPWILDPALRHWGGCEVWIWMASKACLLETSSTNALVISGKRSRRIRVKICSWDLWVSLAKVSSEDSPWIGFVPRLCFRANIGMQGGKRIKKQSQAKKNAVDWFDALLGGQRGVSPDEEWHHHRTGGIEASPAGKYWQQTCTNRIDANRTCPFLTAFHHVRPPWTSSLLTPHHVPRAKGSLKAGKEQTKKFEGKAKEDGEKLGDLPAKEHLQAFKQCK